MAKNFPNIQTLEVYQEGGDNQIVKPCPDATIDKELNINNEERTTIRAGFRPATTEDKCANCKLIDISNRIKKCVDTKNKEIGYCWDHDFICKASFVCDTWDKRITYLNRATIQTTFRQVFEP